MSYIKASCSWQNERREVTVPANFPVRIQDRKMLVAAQRSSDAMRSDLALWRHGGIHCFKFKP